MLFLGSCFMDKEEGHKYNLNGWYHIKLSDYNVSNHFYYFENEEFIMLEPGWSTIQTGDTILLNWIKYSSGNFKRTDSSLKFQQNHTSVLGNINSYLIKVEIDKYLHKKQNEIDETNNDYEYELRLFGNQNNLKLEIYSKDTLNMENLSRDEMLDQILYKIPKDSI